MSEEQNQNLTRRTLLGTAAVGTGALALAGCGGGSSGATSGTGASSTAAGGTPKRGGTFRVGLSDSSSADSIDPLYGDYAFASVALCRNLYDRLMEPDLASPKFVNSLAEEMTPANDLSYWDVRLRDAEWQNGKPVTADDVIYTIKRILNPKEPGSSASALTSIDTKRLQKLDAKTVRIHLLFPDSTLLETMGLQAGTSIVPVGFNPNKPIGSGPFKLQNFNPGQRTTMVRNDNFWGDSGPYLDTLEFVGFADPGTPRLNALTTGEIDGVDHLDFTLARTVEGNPSLELMVSPSYAFNIWEMKTDAPPFDDVRVRQAMKLLADRQQIIDTALGGSKFAELGNDIGSLQDPVYDKSLPQREQDIEQAKSLLKQAGQENLTVTLSVADLTPGMVSTALVLKQNAQAAGVTINVNKVSDPATYFAKNLVEDPFKVDYFQTFPMIGYTGLTLVPSGAYNFTAYDDPQFTKLFEAARGTTDEAKRKSLMAEAQKILYDSGPQAIFAFTHTVEAFNKKFAGISTDLWGYSLNQLRYASVYQQ